jgi:TolA-binding protein
VIVRRWLPYVLAAILGVGTALLVACGDGPAHGLSANQASKLQSDLVDVQQRVDSAHCNELIKQLSQIDTRIDELPSSVDAQLRERLREGAERLRSTSRTECEENRQGTQTDTTTTETQTEPTTTETQPPATTATQPQTTTAPPTTTAVPPAPPEPPVTPPPPVGPGGGTPPEINP